MCGEHNSLSNALFRQAFYIAGRPVDTGICVQYSMYSPTRRLCMSRRPVKSKSLFWKMGLGLADTRMVSYPSQAVHGQSNPFILVTPSSNGLSTEVLFCQHRFDQLQTAADAESNGSTWRISSPAPRKLFAPGAATFHT